MERTEGPITNTRLARRRLQCAAAVASLLGLLGCDTASVRVPGLSLAFPPTTPGVRASSHTQEALFVEAPKDTRANHIGEDVAKSGWTACATDTLASGELQPLVRERLVESITQAGIFGAVNTSSAGARWILSSDVHAFCSQTRGFIGQRAAGIVAISFTLARDGTVKWQMNIEHVVTDADAEYSGSFVTTTEQAMRRTMADAFRLVMRDAVRQIEQSAAKEAS